MKQNNIELILIQISEAHTDKWPIGLIDHPTQHINFEEKILKAQYFNNKFPYFNIYIDSLENEFENSYQAWPDKFVLINKDKFILDNSKYSINAIIINDYASIIDYLVNN